MFLPLNQLFKPQNPGNVERRKRVLSLPLVTGREEAGAAGAAGLHSEASALCRAGLGRSHVLRGQQCLEVAPGAGKGLGDLLALALTSSLTFNFPAVSSSVK